MPPPRGSQLGNAEPLQTRWLLHTLPTLSVGAAAAVVSAVGGETRPPAGGPAPLPRRALRRRVLRGHRGIVLACAFSQDGRSIVSNDEAVVHVWDVQTGACTMALDVAKCAGWRGMGVSEPEARGPEPQPGVEVSHGAEAVA